MVGNGGKKKRPFWPLKSAVRRWCLGLYDATMAKNTKLSTYCHVLNKVPFVALDSH